MIQQKHGRKSVICKNNNTVCKNPLKIPIYTVIENHKKCLISVTNFDLRGGLKIARNVAFEFCSQCWMRLFLWFSIFSLKFDSPLSMAKCNKDDPSESTWSMLTLCSTKFLARSSCFDLRARSRGSIPWSSSSFNLIDNWKEKQDWKTIPTMFKNHPKCRIWVFQFWHFPPIFVLLKLTCLVTLFDRKL